MIAYRLAGQEYQFPCPVLELTPFEVHPANGEISASPDGPSPLPASTSLKADSASLTLFAQTEGLVGGATRHVETWSAPPGFILKVNGGGDFYVAPEGQFIQRVESDSTASPWPQLDREIVVGPVLVLALALRGVWSLHASAVNCNGRAILFLGESGQGKSTLAHYLASTPGMKLAADDILPVTLEIDGLTAWPHFPQLKLPQDAQPGSLLPESLPIGQICLLDIAEEISLHPLSPSEATRIILRHTAGTRLLPPDLLSKHLAFCAQAGSKIQVSRLTYPRRMDALPDVQKLLDTLC